MNSPFANIYLSLMQHIQDQLPAIKFIDMDYNQLENPERPLTDFPCVLVDFPEWTFTELSENVEEGKGMICCKLATDPYDETSSLTPDTYKQAALTILELEWQLYKILKGFKPTIAVDVDGNPTQQAKPLSRKFLTSDNRRPGLKVRPVHFSCSYTDYSAKKQTTRLPATPHITNEIDLSL